MLQPLEENDTLIVFLLANTADRLQPLDLRIYKAAKYFLWNKFIYWYAKEVSKGLQKQGSKVKPVEIQAAAMKKPGDQ